LARKKIKSFVTLVTVFTPPVGQFFVAGSPDSQKGFPMTKLIILAALGFGVVGFGAFSSQWVAPQPCPEAICLIGP
jgi:hypothetical protein